MIKVGVDIDGTIETEVNEKVEPRKDVIQLVELLQKFGCDIYLWSRRGEEHALYIRNMFGLKAKIAPKGSFQPDIAIDNEEMGLGKLNIKV
jgi:hypothetical protein